jgi:hypothetical protein
MSRAYTLGSRVVVVTLLTVAALWCSLWTYVGYERHRAISLLAEAARVRVGDTEASILPLLAHYGGHKRMTERLPPKGQWIDKNEYDYQMNRVSDYSYVLGISPFGTTTGQEMTRLNQAMRTGREAVPPHLRALLGMRDWGTTVQLSIRNGRVQSISAMALVRGQSEWLGNRWELAEGMPHHDMRPRAYAIGAANLTMEDGGGDMIENVFTPEASEEEAETARQFNAGCFTSIRGCNGLCDVAPRALEYLKQNPDAVWNIIPPKCH